MKNPVGRPVLPPELRKTHKRVAVSPETYQKIRLIAKVNRVKIVNLITDLINKAYDNEGNSRRGKKVNTSK